MWADDRWQIIEPADPTENMEPLYGHPTNCINCGAVLHDYICEFCGTDNSRIKIRH